jgi:hypothetical protein
LRLSCDVAILAIDRKTNFEYIARKYFWGDSTTCGRAWSGKPLDMGEERDVDSPLLSERVQIERKQFFFDLKENASGRFLRITEDVGGHRDTIIVPSTGLELFRDTIERAISAEKDLTPA